MYERIRRDTLGDFQEVIQNINDFKAMAASNNIQNGLLVDDMEQFECDLYFDSMQESVVKMHENFFGIVSVPGETLPFRRERVKSRYNIKPPFTRHYMKEKLDLIIGEGKYNLTVNCLNKSITVEASMEDKPYFEELYVTFGLIKPCTMVFITKPYTKSGLVLSNSSEYAKVTYRKMGSGMKMNGWKMGTKRDSKEVKSVTDSSNLVSLTLNDVYEKVAELKVNDSMLISIFAKKKNSDCVEITYNIPDGTMTEITNVKLLDKEGTVLTDSKVYVPCIGNMEFKQKISVRSE